METKKAEEMESWNKTEEQYKLALKADPSDADTLYNYGNLLYEMERWDEAEVQYKLALEADRNDADTLYNYGNLLYEMGRWEEAEVQYKLALKADPNNASTHYNYGILLAEMEREDEAEEQFKFALKADPNNASIYNNYGTLLEEMGRWEEAEEQYNLALKADPNNASIHYNYGILLAEMERFEEAKKQYELALKADTNDADIHCNYGNLLAEMKLFEEAKKQYELALKADPNNIATYYNYGNLLKEMKLEGDATKLYHQAIKANPRSWRSLIYNALISENVGRNEDATKIFEYVARNENKVTDEEIIKVVNFKKEALKEKKPDEKTKVLNEIINTFLEKRENLFKEIDINESKFKKFVDYERSIPEDFFSFLSILRKWNSYTPIFPSVKDDNKGGGYFLFHCGKGIVIDPGFKFIENFYQEGFKVADIDAVLITHAHNDHTADFESILTLVHQHNAAIKKAVREEMKGEDDTDKMKKEIKRRLDEKGKKIDLFMNLGTFKKFSGWLNLKDSNEINNVTVLMPNFTYKLPEDYHGITIHTAKAKHDEIISDKYAIGFILDINGIKVGFTGDTGWDSDRNEAMVNTFKECKPRLIVAHIGSIKSKEFRYVDPACDARKNECFYSQHLGLLGTTMFLNETKPDLTVVSEFGEELKDVRKEIAEVLCKVLDRKCLPGDIGLHIRLEDLGVYCLIERDMIDYKQIQVSSAKGDDSTLLYHNKLSNFCDRSEFHDGILAEAYDKEKTRKTAPFANRLKQGAVTINRKLKNCSKNSSDIVQ